MEKAMHRCEPKGHYRIRGERVVSFSDSRGREGMQYILSYLVSSRSGQSGGFTE
jgi:hypothetical protein